MFEWNTNDDDCIKCEMTGMVLDDAQLCMFCHDEEYEEPDEDSQYTKWIDDIRNP